MSSEKFVNSLNIAVKSQTDTSDTATITKAQLASIVVGSLALIVVSGICMYFLVKKYEWVRRGFKSKPPREASQTQAVTFHRPGESPEEFLQASLKSLREWRRQKQILDAGTGLGSSDTTTAVHDSKKAGKAAKKVKFAIPSPSFSEGSGNGGLNGIAQVHESSDTDHQNSNTRLPTGK